MHRYTMCALMAGIVCLTGTATSQAQGGAVYGLPAHILQIDLGAAISLEEQAGDPSGSVVASYSYRVAGPLRVGAAAGASIPERAETAVGDVTATFGFLAPLVELRFATVSAAIPRLFAGLGFYSIELENDFGSGAVTVDDSKLGLLVGGGVDFKVSRKLGIGGDVQLHQVHFGDEFAGVTAEFGWYQFLDVHASLGIYF